MKLFEVTRHNLRKSENCKAQISTMCRVNDTDLCVAICRFSQVVFVTSNTFTHNLLLALRPLLLFSLFLVTRARSFFRKYQKKKKKIPSKSTKLPPARARSHSPLLASCMTRRLKTAKPTRIKGEPLSGGGMDDENSEGELF